MWYIQGLIDADYQGRQRNALPAYLPLSTSWIRMPYQGQHETTRQIRWHTPSRVGEQLEPAEERIFRLCVTLGNAGMLVVWSKALARRERKNVRHMWVERREK